MDKYLGVFWSSLFSVKCPPYLWARINVVSSIRATWAEKDYCGMGSGLVTQAGSARKTRWHLSGYLTAHSRKAIVQIFEDKNVELLWPNKNRCSGQMEHLFIIYSLFSTQSFPKGTLHSTRTQIIFFHNSEKLPTMYLSKYFLKVTLAQKHNILVYTHKAHLLMCLSYTPLFEARSYILFHF